MTIFHTIQTTSSNHHCSIGLNTYNNTYNQSPHCRCIHNNPITFSCTKTPPKTTSSVSRFECLHQTWVLMKESKWLKIEMVVLARDVEDEGDDDVYVDMDMWKRQQWWLEMVNKELKNNFNWIIYQIMYQPLFIFFQIARSSSNLHKVQLLTYNMSLLFN
jgi:hypothetical protein